MPKITDKVTAKIFQRDSVSMDYRLWTTPRGVLL
jgi:hypothetical protein